MSLVVRKNGGVSSLLSDFFGTSLVDSDFFDLSSDVFPARLGMNVPRANISETSKEFKLELAAPGLQRKDFKVEVDNHNLTISAEKEEESESTNGYSKKEYSFTSFSRSFTLPDNVKEGEIDAKYDNGVLKVSIPKAKETPAKAARTVQVS